MQIKGTIKKIFPTEENKGFKKRLVWVTEDADKYPQTLPIEFTKDNIDTLDRYKVGDNVEIDFNWRSNEWNGKMLLSLSGWKIRMAGGSSLDEPQGSKPQLIKSDVADSPDDLPF